jgi:uncharacterized protein (TIGR01777 family)
MKILIAGSHGMVGSAVTRHLAGLGHEVVRLVRHLPGAGEVRWDPDGGDIDAPGLEGFDGVVQLATMPWPLRWTPRFKQAAHANRIGANGLLARSLAGCKRKPRVLVCASGMGYYAPAGDEIITEDTPPGTGFLGNLQRDGEAATAPASAAGIRVVHLRIPPVLGGDAIRRGTSQIGQGQQWMSWVGRDELAGIIAFALERDSLSGPVNPVSPNPLRNADFAAITAGVLGRKPGPALPAWLVRMLLGEMGEEFALASRRIEPRRLQVAGYRFQWPNLEDALRHELANGV